MSLPHNKIILSNLLSPVNDKSVRWLPGHGLWLKKAGDGYKIFKVLKNKELIQATKKLRSYELIDYEDSVLSPSFCDLHFHWVQDDVREMPKDNLLDWLQNYTWPSEKKFQNYSFAKKKAKSFSEKLINSGTLTGACFSSIHLPATKLALDTFPGDFVIGNVQMTMNSPKYLLQEKKDCLEITNELSKKYKKNYAVTPRFAITTHPDVMNKSGKIANRNNSFIQTHLCETEQEIAAVLDIYHGIPGFEKVKSYTEVYQKCGILGPKTIMGHGIYLNKDEILLLKKSKTNLAHCPTSNAPIRQGGLGSGLFDLKTILKSKIPWGLGSDIGAGPHLSMIDVMNSFVKQQKVSGLASWRSAFFRATLASEIILQNGHRRGSLEPGKEANFIVLGEKRPSSLKNLPGEEVLQKVFSLKNKNRSLVDKKIFATFWKGKCLKGV